MGGTTSNERHDCRTSRKVVLSSVLLRHQLQCPHADLLLDTV